MQCTMWNSFLKNIQLHNIYYPWVKDINGMNIMNANNPLVNIVSIVDNSNHWFPTDNVMTG